MAEPLDQIIFVGFPIPDRSTEEGAAAYRHIMDSANVPIDSIFFYSADTNIKDVIRGSFVFDKAAPNNYRIGRALCIGSADLDATYRHRLDIFGKKLRFFVRTGYETVDLSQMSEAETSHWLETSRYKKIEPVESDEEDELLSLLLGESDENVEKPSQQESPDPVEEVHDSRRDGVLGEPDESSVEFSSAFNERAEDEIDFDSLMDMVPEPQEASSNHPTIDSEGLKDRNQVEVPSETSEALEKRAEADSAEPDYDINDLFSDLNAEEQTDDRQHQTEEVDQGDIDDFLRDDNDLSSQAQVNDDVPSATDKVSPPVPPERVPDGPVAHQSQGSRSVPVRSEPIHEEPAVSKEMDDNLINDLFDEPLTKDEPVGNDPVNVPGMGGDDFFDEDHDQPAPQKEEITHTAHNQQIDEEDDIPLDDMDIVDDDMELVRKMERNRARAERRRKLEELEKLSALEDEEIPEEEEELHRDRFGESAAALKRKAEHTAESAFDETGRRKTYREYLNEDEAKHQDVAERIQEKFGNMNFDAEDKRNDLQYVGEGTGRIILCTSGKGGVGKSLVANGLAMALSLGRAKDSQTNTGASTARTWLIESDYNSPQLAMAFRTGNKSIGNIASSLAKGKNSLSTRDIRRLIEENVHIDEDTGIHVLACPPLSSRKSSKEIPYAILLAVKYASDQGDDVIIDHGNLTSGEYSELDQVLSLQLAHRVVLVANMGCIPETQSALQLLCDRERNSIVPARPVPSVSVVLNSARREQYLVAQKMLRPFEIISVLPPIDDFRAENSLKGSTYLPDASKGVQKAVMDRCGIMLTKLGYESLRKYFSLKSSFNTGKRSERRNIFKQVADFLTGASR